jgi:hypothetical protein
LLFLGPLCFANVFIAVIEPGLIRIGCGAVAGAGLCCQRCIASAYTHTRALPENGVYWYLFSNHCTRKCIHKKCGPRKPTHCVCVQALSHTHIHICRSGRGRVVLPTHTHAHTHICRGWGEGCIANAHTHICRGWGEGCIANARTHICLVVGEGCIANARTHGVAVEDMVEAVEARPPECTSLQIRFRSPRCFLVFLSFCQHACRQPGE